MREVTCIYLYQFPKNVTQQHTTTLKVNKKKKREGLEVLGVGLEFSLHLVQVLLHESDLTMY